LAVTARHAETDAIANPAALPIKTNRLVIIMRTSRLDMQRPMSHRQIRYGVGFRYKKNWRSNPAVPFGGSRAGKISDKDDDSRRNRIPSGHEQRTVVGAIRGIEGDFADKPYRLDRMRDIRAKPIERKDALPAMAAPSTSARKSNETSAAGEWRVSV
jgi:hypothetical protein